MRRVAAVLLALMLTLTGYQAIRLEKATSERSALQRELSDSMRMLEAAQREIEALRLTDAALRAQVRALGAEPAVPVVRVAPGAAPDVAVIVPTPPPSRTAPPRPIPTPRPCLLGLVCP